MAILHANWKVRYLRRNTAASHAQRQLTPRGIELLSTTYRWARQGPATGRIHYEEPTSYRSPNVVRK